VLRVYTHVLLDVYARGARECGISGGQTGMVTALQRAGSGLNTNLHFHTLVLDGVLAEKPRARWHFSRRRHRAMPRSRQCWGRSASGCNGCW
jgi:putative transposase